jgi:hypothetical protein
MGDNDADKSEIRNPNRENPKHEIRNPNQIQMTQTQNPKRFVAISVSTREPGSSIRILDFEIVSDFVLGISESHWG